MYILYGNITKDTLCTDNVPKMHPGQFNVLVPQSLICVALKGPKLLNYALLESLQSNCKCKVLS